MNGYYSPITGVVLSGGKSLRMGENKAFIKIDGTPMIDRICALFQTFLKETIIVTNQREPYLYLKAKVFEDLIPDTGALGGLYTGLFYSSFPYSFVVACDMPYLNVQLITYLINQIERVDAVVPQTDDGLQPLHAVYSKSCIEAIQQTLQEGKKRITDFFPLIRVKTVKTHDLLPFDPQLESFINLNRPDDVTRYQTRQRLYDQE